MAQDGSMDQTIAGLSETELDIFLDIVQALNGTIINIKRYPPGASIIKMALERGVKNMGEFFANRDNFTISENERSMLLDNELLDTKHQGKAFVQSFITQLHARAIRSLTFRSGLTIEELVTFLEVLAEPPDLFKKIEDVNATLAEKGIAHIEVDKKVFVAIQKGQTVANISDLEKLAQTRGANVQSGDVSDGMFFSFLLSKIPLEEYNIKKDQIDSLKKKLDFDKIKQEQNLDFDRIGPILAASLEGMLRIDVGDPSEFLGKAVDGGSVRVSDKIPDQPFAAMPVSGETEPPLAPEEQQREDIIAHDTAVTRERDRNVERLMEHFTNIGKAIMQFENNQVRAKLLGDFIKVVTKFKSLTLARVLTSKIEQAEGGIDMKSAVLASLNMERKAEVLDMVLARLQRFMDGISDDDFGIDLDELNEAERTFTRVQGLLKTKDDKIKLGERVQRGLGMARLIKREVTDEESLLILKMRRMVVKPPEFFISEYFVTNFPATAKRLADAGRQDIIKKVLEKIAGNFVSNDRQVRASAINAFIKIQRSLFDNDDVALVAEIYAILARQLEKEDDSQIYAIILASMVYGFPALIRAEKYGIASNLLAYWDKLADDATELEKVKILKEARVRIFNNQEILSQLIDRYHFDEKTEDDGVGKVLHGMPAEAVTPQILIRLKEAEDLPMRKKCFMILGQYGDAVIPVVLAELQEAQTWFYYRNLLELLSNTSDDRIVEPVKKFMKHPDERVRKAAIHALMKQKGEETVKVITESLQDKEDSIRKIAVNYLGHQKSETAAAALIGLLKDGNLVETDSAYAVEVISGLGRIGRPEAVDVLADLIKPKGLKGLLAKRNETIVLAVIRSFSRFDVPKAKAVAKKYLSDKNPAIAKAAQNVVKGN